MKFSDLVVGNTFEVPILPGRRLHKVKQAHSTGEYTIRTETETRRAYYLGSYNAVTDEGFRWMWEDNQEVVVTDVSLMLDFSRIQQEVKDSITYAHDGPVTQTVLVARAIKLARKGKYPEMRTHAELNYTTDPIVSALDEALLSDWPHSGA